MVASSRVVVLMSPEEKLALEAKASMAGDISSAELVRRAVEAYDIARPGEAEELGALLDLFKQTHLETLAQLDRTDQTLDAALHRLAELDA